jgi:hypothetical protein
MESGFTKVYADDAVVWHSHENEAAAQYKIGVEEGMLFRNYLGIDIGGSEVDLYARYEGACDVDKGRFPSVEIPIGRHLTHIASILGRFAGTTGRSDMFANLLPALAGTPPSEVGNRFKKLLQSV